MTPQQAKEFLKITAETPVVPPCLHTPNEAVKRLALSDIEAREIISYLNSNGYVTKLLDGAGCPYPMMFQITGKGTDWINDYSANPTNVQNITIGTNNGTVGNNNTVTNNYYFSFEKFDNQIKQCISTDSPDYQEIIKLRKKMKAIEEYEIPLSKGYFKEFSNLMQEHSWLSGPVVSFLMQRLFG